MTLDGTTRLRKFRQREIHIVVVTQMGHPCSSLALEKKVLHLHCLSSKASEKCATVLLLAKNKGQVTYQFSVASHHVSC